MTEAIIDLQLACDTVNTCDGSPLSISPSTSPLSASPATRDLPTEADLALWVQTVLDAHEDTGHELTVRIVTQEESQQLNHQYRGKDKPTNVLSFPFESPPDVILPLLGDLIVCADVVEREALEQHKTLKDHWTHMIIHGCLHLLGYDHIEEEEAEEMESLEIELLASLNIKDPYYLD